MEPTQTSSIRQVKTVHQTVRVAPVMDISRAAEFRLHILSLLSKPSAIEIDLSQCAIMDSASLAVLIEGQAIAKASGVSLLLKNPTQQVLNLMKLTRTHDLFFQPPMSRTSN